MSIYYQDENVTLYHGDCRDVMADFERHQFDAMVTDPPYGVDRAGQMLGQISANYHDKGTHSRGYADHDPAMFECLMSPMFEEASQVLAPGSPIVCFGATRTIHEVAAHAADAWLVTVDQIAFVGGGTYAKSRTTLVPTYEPALLLRTPGKPREINPARSLPNVVDSRKGRQASDHPTTKPAAWMDWCIALVRGKNILDPFAGSGSTLVAAKAAGVRAVGIEIDEAYCEIAARRLSQGALDLGISA